MGCGMTGLSCTERLIGLSDRTYLLGIDLSQAVAGVLNAGGLPKSSTIFGACDERRMWITCRWLNLLQLTTRESGATAAIL